MDTSWICVADVFAVRSDKTKFRADVRAFGAVDETLNDAIRNKPSNAFSNDHSGWRRKHLRTPEAGWQSSAIGINILSAGEHKTTAFEHVSIIHLVFAFLAQ
ncbi:unnamed protein product [Toxocara canis]|uniref:Transposase n=1 Tax=Toxocara canis TaxID=6265 RepID=A0A183V406_TOXCA|nr:unnamed protein product [Toxocara canis]